MGGFDTGEEYELESGKILDITMILYHIRWTVLLLLQAFFLRANAQTTSYAIQGRISDPGLEGSQLLLRVNGYTDTTKVSAGRFEFQGVSEIGRAEIRERRSAEPDYLTRTKPVQSLKLFVDGTPTRVEGATLSTARVLGNAWQREYDALRSAMLHAMESRPEVGYIAQRRAADSILFHYMERNPESFVAQSLFQDIFEGDHLPSFQLGHKDWTDRIWQGFPDSVRQSSLGKSIAFLLQGNSNIKAVGELAPNFVLPTPDSTWIDLADYRGKYVLLEFWASWCKPCRQMHPHLREIQERYGEGNFKLISVSMDAGPNARERWVNAIEQDRLTWTQVSELSRNSTIQAAYGFMGVPMSFLIDPDGYIVAHALKGDYLDAYLAEVLAGTR